MEHQKDGITVGTLIVQAERFADGQAMVANSNPGLQRIMDNPNKTLGVIGIVTSGTIVKTDLGDWSLKQL